MTENVFLGMQGWDHPEWVDVSGQLGAPPYRTLEAYSQRFSTVEVDETFYGIPPEPVLRGWYDSVPPSFVFALKAPQQVTHEQRFSGSGSGGGFLKLFLDRVSLLDEKLGPILMLAPPAFEPDESNREALSCFVRELPDDFRWALELRNAAWFTDDVFDLLEGKNVALVTGENRWVRRSSMLEVANRTIADFAYLRWCGIANTGQAPAADDRRERVTATWRKPIERIRGLTKTVYGYFGMSAFGDGARSAEELQFALGQQWLEASVSDGASAAANRDAD